MLKTGDEWEMNLGENCAIYNANACCGEAAAHCIQRVSKKDRSLQRIGFHL